jgi:26S proteasome regulatory subunit T4
MPSEEGVSVKEPVRIVKSSGRSWRYVGILSFTMILLILQLLNQMDGFDSLGRTKLIMATNRPDTLDPALLRPGRLDRKIEIPLPNEQGRLEILKIHAKGINKSGDIDYEAVVKLSDGFNGADLRNVCTEAGMFAIRDDR